MARRRTYKTFVGDFETTVYEGQEDTEVWASALVEIGEEDVQIFHSLDETFDYLLSLDCNIMIYYHNLKFDGYFWLDYLLVQKNFSQAFNKVGEQEYDLSPMREYEMPNRSIKYTIGEMGQWYNIIIHINKHYITIRDSLKLLPFSVRKIGKSFGTKHKKLDMEYTGFRYAGCTITEEEKKYIANDVLVVKEALEILFAQGHDRATIGSCCLEEFKLLLGCSGLSKLEPKDLWYNLFPDLRDYTLDKEQYGASNAEEYIRNSYKGGWCYLVKGKENHIYENGITADVNSLYPSMMSSESGNEYPVGLPDFWKGNEIPKEAKDKYYFVRIKTTFNLKENYLPCIQIKRNKYYKSNEWLETSDIFDKGIRYNMLADENGNIKPITVTLTLTMTDYQLIQEHYNLTNFEILDGCYFHKTKGIFDEYIEKYKKIKMESKGAIRELAKLFLNNLYGKMATDPINFYKYAYVNQDNIVKFVTVKDEDKKPVYIPIGSAITSYARNFTIRAAQANYYGKNKAGFIYADTDSIHCDLSAEQLKNVPVDDVAFCHWKLEGQWDKAIFVRQKTYIEHIIKENLKPVDPYYSIKCAGMPDTCKDLLLYSINGIDTDSKEYKKMSDEAKAFVLQRRTMEDFKLGLKVPEKLFPKHIRGGIVLKTTTYEMR